METLDRPATDLPAPAGEQPIFEINTSRNFTTWLKEVDLSLAFSTYQVGKVFFLGVKNDGKLWVFNRNIGRCLGMAAKNNDLWIASDSHIHRFVNAMLPDQITEDGQDALYVPQLTYLTGDLDTHDIGLTEDGKMIFANTLFNCVSTVSETHSFLPLWQPAFISRLAAEDRCHLNGLAMRDGILTHVTAIAESDTFDGWRNQRRDGGVLIDVARNEIVVTGLSMPHSPRWHNNQLWLHNSGTGEFGRINFETGKFEPHTFCPGYLRGLAFHKNFAIVGLSRPRDNKTFTGLALDEALTSRRMDARCGIYIIDLATGDIVHSVTIEGLVTELYDVVSLPGLKQPGALSPTSPDLKRMFSIP